MSTRRPSLAGLPAGLHSVAGRSMALAHSVIGHIAPALIPEVRAAVNAAFLDGDHVATLVCAGDQDRGPVGRN